MSEENNGPKNAEGLVFRDWKMKVQSVLPPYGGGPLHSPGKPGRDWSLFGSDPNTDTVKVVQLSSLATEDELRAFIRAEVRAALEDDARELRENKAFQPVNAHQHRRVEMTEESGLHWRGVLYATNAEQETTDHRG